MSMQTYKSFACFYYLSIHSGWEWHQRMDIFDPIPLLQLWLVMTHRRDGALTVCILMWVICQTLDHVKKLKGWTWNPSSPVMMWSGEIATYLGELCDREEQAKGNPLAWTIINGPHFMPYFNIFSVHCMYPRLPCYVCVTPDLDHWDQLRWPSGSQKIHEVLFFFFLNGQVKLCWWASNTIFNVARIHLYFF